LAGALGAAGSLQSAGKTLANMDFSQMRNPFSGLFTTAPVAINPAYSEQTPNNTSSSYWRS
jgi:hypothetical protein